jgi:putative hydrolase of the HAD superfamily
MTFSKTTAWLFDLDNTLYSPHSDVFPQIHKRMSLFIMQRFNMDEAQAAKRREDYFYNYGTTMRGLMVEHQIDPGEFMDFVHAVDLASLAPDPRWNQALQNLPGRKIIFTNGDHRHAKRILEHLEMATEFPDIFDITAGDYACKPDEGPYLTLLKKYGLKADECCMFDDMEKNLETAARLGMRTVWFRHEAEWQRHKPKDAHHYPHCHYVTDDLISFVEKLGTKT